VLPVLAASLAPLAGTAAQPATLSGRYAVLLPSDTIPPPIPREFRGVWVATVGNIDWPSRPGLSVDAQKAELVAILDRAAGLRLNAVIFQVRPAADALYKSPYEPWSAVLTGTMGKAPSPAYDPLAFAVAEAHRRGLELHAWFNPYRARYSGTRGPVARTHVSRTLPSVVKRYGPYLWMDPGEPAVRALTTKVILDVVRRYDIDGVHLDDYFYPYPERDRRGRVIDFPDGPSWKRYVRTGGTLSRGDWRRRNVDLLIESLYREIKKTKPWVRFGVSPFGIWRPGYPASVRGFDQFESLYADARKWVAKGWLDYLTPQLYWRAGAPAQNYAQLLSWWADQNARGRHLWPGNADYKVANAGERWSATEIADQIRLTREQPGAEGNIHFNEGAFVANWDDLSRRLATGPYAEPALPPASPWLSSAPSLAPSVSRRDAAGMVILDIGAGTDGAREQHPSGPSAADTYAAPAGSAPRWWLVRARYPDGWHAQVFDAAQRSLRLAADAAGQLPELVAVSTVDIVGVESEAVYLMPPASAGAAQGRRR
jgi:uncharacterized lipoprotein YddW (UPF0748 family)